MDQQDFSCRGRQFFEVSSSGWSAPIPGMPYVEGLNSEVSILQLKEFCVGQAVSRLMSGESEDSTGVVKANHLQEGRFSSFSNKPPPFS